MKCLYCQGETHTDYDVCDDCFEFYERDREHRKQYSPEKAKEQHK